MHYDIISAPFFILIVWSDHKSVHVYTVPTTLLSWHANKYNWIISQFSYRSNMYFYLFIYLYFIYLSFIYMYSFIIYCLYMLQVFVLWAQKSFVNWVCDID